MRSRYGTRASEIKQEDKTWLRILVIYQVIRGIFGQSLLPFPIDILFRIFIFLTGYLVFFNKKTGIIFLFIILIVSIPNIMILSKTSYFYWPPVVFTLPINIGFSLIDYQTATAMEETRISLNGVYVVLIFSSVKAFKNLLVEK
jgi:hypothetical protein